jgi:hypothetical protein
MFSEMLLSLRLIMLAAVIARLRTRLIAHHHHKS